MSTEIVKTEDLTSYLDILGLAPKLTQKEKEQFVQIAQIYGLNPFKREIYASKYGDNFSIITGYEVYIKRAERTGQLDGWTATTSGSVATGDLKATVTIYRKDRSHPFVWEALYEECVQRTREGKVTKFWEKAAFMTKKVAISQGFRLCFSDELAGMPYTSDELPDVQTEDISHVEVVESVKAIEPKVDQSLIDTLNACTTPDEVKKIYKSIPKAEQPIYKDLVIELGEKLKGAA